MPKCAQAGELTDGVDSDALMVVIADRINQALDRDPTIAQGHGRVAAFARRYQLLRTTAHRILAGTTFPPYSVLMQRDWR